MKVPSFSDRNTILWMLGERLLLNSMLFSTDGKRGLKQRK
jgi:hypothetical protein